MFYFSNFPKADFKNFRSMNYDEYWKDRGVTINKKLKEREQIMLEEIPPGSTILDIGCGNSLLPFKLREKNCTVTVSDISSVILEAYKKAGFETLHVNLEDTSHYIFHQNNNNKNSTGKKFDYIIMSEVLEHTRNPEDILMALKPYTKNFILTIPNSAFYRYRLHLMFTGTFIRQWVHHPSEHLRYWSHTDFLEWLDALGFKVTKTIASNGLDIQGIKFYKYFPNLFGLQICYVVESGS